MHRPGVVPWPTEHTLEARRFDLLGYPMAWGVRSSLQEASRFRVGGVGSDASSVLAAAMAAFARLSGVRCVRERLEVVEDPCTDIPFKR